tara:strand:+ start:204 stop:1421 length:1218 start_codon:yes stop_codon:yes gene_type:complete
MDELTVQLAQLMAQRNVLSFNFCCYKDNMVNNTQKLLTIARLIQQENNNQCILSAQNVEQITKHINGDHHYSDDELALVIALKLMLAPSLQHQLLPRYLNSAQPQLQSLALAIAKLLGNDLIITLDFTQATKCFFTEKSNKRFPQQAFIQQVLFHLYYHKTLNDYLNEMMSEYKNKKDSLHFENNLSSLSWLTVNVLSGCQNTGTVLSTGSVTNNRFDVQAIAAQFIQHDYMHSTLFDVYISSLNEHQITQLVNQLSVDKSFIPYIIHVMGISGYAKFIPFLAQYLQTEGFVLAAYQALRLLLGNKLDALIPLAVQFNSDIDKRQKDLRYYGAKILYAWQQGLSYLGVIFEHDDKRILNGTVLTAQSVEKILLSGSQWHQRVAMLYKLQWCGKPFIQHPNALDIG